VSILPQHLYLKRICLSPSTAAAVDHNVTHQGSNELTKMAQCAEHYVDMRSLT